MPTIINCIVLQSYSRLYCSPTADCTSVLLPTVLQSYCQLTCVNYQLHSTYIQLSNHLCKTSYFKFFICYSLRRGPWYLRSPDHTILSPADSGHPPCVFMLCCKGCSGKSISQSTNQPINQFAIINSQLSIHHSINQFAIQSIAIQQSINQFTIQSIYQSTN